MKTYYLVDVDYGVSLARFTGVKKPKSYFAQTSETVFGYIFIGRSGIIFENKTKKVFESLVDAIDFAIVALNKKREDTSREVTEMSDNISKLITLMDEIKLRNGDKNERR